jgi:two-component system, LytTR family, response regulator
MNAILVDDEKKGRETLNKLLETYCPEVNVVAMASNADEAYDLIKRHSPDLVFLDIEMPNGNGFYLLEKFDNVLFHVIFTTAYDNYAIQAIKHHALDYLLKPIDIDELKATIYQVKKISPSPSIKNHYADFLSQHRLQFPGRIALPIKDGSVFLSISDIIRIASDGSYSIFYTSDGRKYVVSKHLKEYETLLPAKEFFRAHKSHLINIKKVKKYLRTDGYFAEMEDGSMVEISRRKKDEFLQIMSEVS